MIVTPRKKRAAEPLIDPNEVAVAAEKTGRDSIESETPR